MENTPDGIKDRLDTVEEKISELWDIAIETFQKWNTERKKHWRKNLTVGCGGRTVKRKK